MGSVLYICTDPVECLITADLGYTVDLCDLCDMYDLYDPEDLYDLYDLYRDLPEV